MRIIAKQDITFANLDKHIDCDPDNVKIISTRKWYTRIWFLITNPLCYIFKGYNRY